MLGKITRSTPRPPFGPPVVRVAAGSSRLASKEARKSLLFTPVRESSGECRLRYIAHHTEHHGNVGWNVSHKWRIIHVSLSWVHSRGVVQNG
jgi:hypothetical protein